MSRFKRIRRVPALAVAFSLAALVVAALAIADIITGDANSITSNIDPSVEKAPGTSGAGLFALVVQNGTPVGDPNGCNAGTGGSKPPVVLAISSNQSWLTLTQSTVSVTDCDQAAAGLQNAATVNYQVSSSAPAGAAAVVTATYSTGGTAGGQYQTGSFQVKTPAAPADTTAPTSSASAKNADDSAYSFGDWTKQNVTVTLSGADNAGGSGLKEIRYTANGTDPTASTGTVYSSPFTITTEGTTTVKWRAIDNLGNIEAVQSRQVKIDKTAPSVDCDSADGIWHATDVSVACTASDGGSGVDPSGDESFSLSTNVAAGTETNNAQTATKQVSDAVGNEATAGPVGGNMVDKKGPAISCATPAPTFGVGQSPANVTGTATDGGSGLQTSATPSAAADTSTVVGNPKSVSLAATDNVGNTSNQPCAYSVVYGFNGFFQPVDMNGVFNKAKAGSAIPVKFSLDGAPQPGSNTPGSGGASPVMTSASAVLVACPTSAGVFDLLEEVAADSVSGLKYDPTADQWIYVWKTTTALANSCRQLRVVLADGTTKTANFQFTK